MPCPICGSPKYNGICPSCRKKLLKIIDDPIQFFEKLLILRFKNGQPQFFKPFGWQREFLLYAKKRMDNDLPIRVVVKKGRRVGFSELMSGFMLWYVIRGAILEGEDKYWDVISASHSQSKRLVRSTKKMALRNPLIKSSIKVEKNGWLKASDQKIEFGNDTVEAIITALSSGGATKRGRSPSGQTFDEAAQIPDADFNDLDISSMASDDHQVIGSTPYDDKGFFYDLIKKKPDDYKFFEVPTATLNNEGMMLLSNGEIRKININHITSTIGYKITAEKILERLKKYDYVTAAREIFGEFISSSDLYYPPSLVNRFNVFIEDNVFTKSSFEELPSLINEYSPDRILFGIDWAGKGNDKTAIVGFLEKDGHYDMFYYDSWSRMKYTDQYEEVADTIKYIAPQAEVYVDYTGTQDASYDSLYEKGLNVYPVEFTAPNKRRMAEIMYNLIITERLKLILDEDVFNDVVEVKNNLRGRNDHLGDFAAAIWCALSSINPFDSNDGDISYELGGYLDSYGMDSDYDIRKVLRDFN